MADTENMLKLRRSYRELINQVEENEEDLSDVSRGGLQNMLSETDRLFRSHEDMGAGEMLLDSSLVSNLASICKRRVYSYNANTLVFRPVDFAQRLAFSMLADCPSGDLNAGDVWARLGRRVARWFRPVPGMRFVLGTLPQQPATPRTRVQRQRNETAAVTPQLVDSSQKNGDASTPREFIRIYHVLKKAYQQAGRRPICFFEFAYHPTSFNATVENVFHVAFLVRDQLVRVFEQDGALLIEPLVSKPAQDAGATSVVSNQALFSLERSEWEHVVKTFAIRKPMIPSSST